MTLSNEATRVVFVHGLWMTGADMWWLRRRVKRDGFSVKQFSYPTVRCNVKQNAARLNDFLKQYGSDVDVIHLVGHSLGGLVIRQLFHDYPEQKPGRIVTLGTPHRGSAIAHIFNRNRVGRWILGNSIECGLLGNVAPWLGERELGVIAGTKDHGIDRVFCALPRPNDGTVAVEETCCDGMTDHLQLPVAHSSMLLSREVARQVIHFLRQGTFARL